MQTALAFETKPLATVILNVAAALADIFDDEGRAVTRQTLKELFQSETGESDASGTWSMRDAYTALEHAQIMLVLKWASRDDASALTERIADLAARLPVQSYRSESQIDLQQFSTPLPLAWAAGAAAQLVCSDTVLEPSAGTGLLALRASCSGAKLILNEIDDLRRACLEASFPHANIASYDGAIIDDALAPHLVPSVVLMNPPFSRSLDRGVDRHAAARHLKSAFTRLGHGGRLVAILPPSCNVQSIKSSNDEMMLCASIGLSGAFLKHGTSIDTRLVVIDKGVTRAAAVTGEADNVEMFDELIAKIAPRTKLSGSFSKPKANDRKTPVLFGGFAKRKPIAPAPSPRTAQLAPVPLDYTILETPAPMGEQAGIYLPYRPSRIAIADAAPHPTELVESIAMGSVAAPVPSYKPVLSKSLVKSGALSAAQLETVIYAGNAFERDIPGLSAPQNEGCELAAANEDEGGIAYRHGYFLGDGTGAGKGRQLAAVILDQWLRGNRRHIWLTKNETLLEDARRDWEALGGVGLDIQSLSAWKLGEPVRMGDGILFVGYPTLRSGRETATRLDQILEWAGDGFEGVLAFDEAHAMANAAGGEGSRGKVAGSLQGVTGVRLQNLLPRARVLYASATGASDVNNLAYTSRLGLWGPETAFATRSRFVEDIRKGGIAAMELVARDLKSLGLYTARALSFAGVEYDVLAHELTEAQIRIYDAYAAAWEIIHNNLEAALETTNIVDDMTGDTLNSGAKAAAKSVFEGTKQRFFGQLLLSMKLPSLIPAIERDLEDGNSTVIQIVSTAEAMLNRQLATMSAEERENLSLELSPREYVVDYLVKSFPVQLMRVFMDENGNPKSEPMHDDDGNPVICRSAAAAREALIEKLCAMPAIGTALDALIERFGTGAVAEVTGRTRRLVPTDDGGQRVDRRSGKANIHETNAFMDGDKRILIFSDAGGTGRSYHADLGAKNQERRIHYLLEPGWRADAAIQGLGRTHRTA
ncbi:MAG: strawberry notch family protein, partial [Pacificimonas sp.]